MIKLMSLLIDQGVRPATNLLDGSSPLGKDSCKTPQQRLKR